MYSFGTRSQMHLDTLVEPLQLIMYRAIRQYDFSIICGHRGEAKQNAAFDRGASKLKWPNSRHNHFPSAAVDIVPYPIDWENLQRFHELADVIKATAEYEGVPIQWGYDLWGWDMPHWQLPAGYDFEGAPV